MRTARERASEYIRLCDRDVEICPEFRWFLQWNASVRFQNRYRQRSWLPSSKLMIFVSSEISGRTKTTLSSDFAVITDPRSCERVLPVFHLPPSLQKIITGCERLQQIYKYTYCTTTVGVLFASLSNNWFTVFLMGIREMLRWYFERHTWYSARLIHNWWKVPRLANMLPPIHALYCLSGTLPAAVSLIFYNG